MKILPVTSLLVVLALARNSAAQSNSGFIAPWNPTTSLALSAQIALTAGLTAPTPTAPASVTLVALNLQDVRIAWADRSSNEEGFEIQRETPVTSKVTILTTVGRTGAGATSFVDTPGLGSFRYRVRAFNASGSSAWTKWASVRVRF